MSKGKIVNEGILERFLKSKRQEEETSRIGELIGTEREKQKSQSRRERKSTSG